jgi:Ammonium Transporter Family
VADGALFGNPGQLGVQAAAVLGAIVYSGTMSFVLLELIGFVIPLRADAEDESIGLDETQHGEEAYGLLGGVTTLTGHGSGRRCRLKSRVREKKVERRSLILSPDRLFSIL